MRLKKLASSAAVLSIAAAGVIGGAGAAHAATGTTLHPYVDFGLGLVANPLDSVAVGQTDPGVAGSKLCLIAAVDSGTTFDTDNTVAPTALGGKLNGASRAGHSGDINIVYVNGDDASAALGAGSITTDQEVSSCVQTDVSFDSVGTAVTAVPGKKSAKISLVGSSAVQPGILAAASTTIAVTHPTGSTIALPTGATLLSALHTSSGGVDVDYYKLAATVTKTKSDFGATPSCADTEQVVQVDNVDDYTNNGNKPTSSPFTADISTMGVAYDKHPGSGTSTNETVATFHECAQADSSSPGKAQKTSIAITCTGGSTCGAVSVALAWAQTYQPQTWDTTIGACKLGKPDTNRVLTCKGGYGSPVPFALSVRQNAGNAHDPYGLWDRFYGRAPFDVLASHANMS